MKAPYSFLFLSILIYNTFVFATQTDSIPIVTTVDLHKIPSRSVQKYWLQVGSDAFNKPITIPILIAKGSDEGPILGLTAALHGNELNGIPIIQQVFKEIDIHTLKGTVIAIPGINPLSIFNDKRRFINDVDLNRIFPGKVNGNRSQQVVYQINEKIIKLLDFHIDMHTASFGRINTMYARADMSNDTLATMAKLQNPDIILSNKGNPSFGSTNSQTIRATAIQQGTYSITLEYGNPQVYQSKMIERGKQGIITLMRWLGMINGSIEIPKIENICSRSYWVYTDQGGLLEVVVNLDQRIKKGELIGVIKNPFGDVIDQYFAPEDGIIIGKSTNPINMSGGRIIHLGILQKDDH